MKTGFHAFVLALTLLPGLFASDPRMQKAYRRPEKNGWHYIHLEGTPAQIGYQHGYLLAKEIQDAYKVAVMDLTHDSAKPVEFFREASRTVLWPHIEAEYRDELQGIADGLRAQGVKLDVWDVVMMNGFLELSPYYLNWYEKQQGRQPMPTSAPERCSAFVATGSYTKDGKIVIGHNNWSGYIDGTRWNLMFDIVPAKGHRILMDGFPGLIHSGDDFGINSAGIVITETTITQFNGFDPNGVPEFVRARKAMQYSGTIDEFLSIMKEGNNGGYANTWLVADRNTNEIARLELGLKHVTVERTKDGYFVGSNFPSPELAKAETDFDVNNPELSPNARHVRADQLVQENKGKIDVAFGKRYLSDHYDPITKKIDPNERTLCGHIDLSPRGNKPWQPEYGPAGTVQAKVTDADMAAKMTMVASMGHPCGIHFKAAEYLKQHREFRYQSELLRDLNSHPWTTVQSK